MAITLSLANKYFAGHVMGSAWDDFDEVDQDKAIVHATRLLQTRAGTDWSDATTTIEDAEIKERWDLAVYEQAFHMLKNSPLPRDGETGAPRYLFGENDGQAPDQNDIEAICPAALRYITGPDRPFPQIEMKRG